MDNVSLGALITSIVGIIFAGTALVIQARSSALQAKSDSVVLARDWQQIATEQAKEIKGLKAELAALIAKVDELSSKLEESIKDRQELQDRLAVTATQLSELTEQRNIDCQTILGLQGTIEKLQAIADEQPALLEKIRNLEDAIENLEAENVQLRQQVAELTVHLDTVLKENHALRLENGELKKAIDEKKGQGW
jgi:chromosome segregation ATPase